MPISKMFGAKSIWISDFFPQMLEYLHPWYEIASEWVPNLNTKLISGLYIPHMDSLKIIPCVIGRMSVF